MYKRTCPTCGREIKYTLKDSCTSATRKNSKCRSCGTKQQYINDPTKNVGSKNGRTGKKLRDVLTNKYGKSVGDKKYKAFIEKIKEHGFKSGSKNISYGTIRENSGRSYKGWYKNIFFRSSLELAFLLDFEFRHKRLPVSAECGRFHAKYNKGNNTTYPDFYDEKTKTVFEIKVSVFIKQNKSKIIAIKNICRKNGLLFKIITEKDIKNYDDYYYKKLITMHENGIITLTDKSIEKAYKKLNKKVVV